MTTILVDWSAIADFDAFFDSVFAQTQAPAWHGRNLNAINDSWVAGGICVSGPPFHFVFRHLELAAFDLQGFANEVLKFAVDSVKENGGSITTEN